MKPDRLMVVYKTAPAMAMIVTAMTRRQMDTTLTFNASLGTPTHSFMNTPQICPLSTYVEKYENNSTTSARLIEQTKPSDDTCGVTTGSRKRGSLLQATMYLKTRPKQSVRQIYVRYPLSLFKTCNWRTNI